MFTSTKKNPEKALSTEMKKEQALCSVSVDTMKNGSLAYRSMLGSAFEEQAARVIQHQWAKKKKKAFKPSDGGVSRRSLSMAFIQEPKDDSMVNHLAKQIKANQWVHLAYHAPEFERNLYKALRMGKLTADEMVTAYLLFQAKDLMKYRGKTPAIKQYSYEAKGPYHPKQIDYSDAQSLFDFYQKLTRLPKHERCYFAVNCSPRFELVFLHQTIRRSDCWTISGFPEMVNKNIQKMAISEAAKKALLDDVLIMTDQRNGMKAHAKKRLLASLLASKIEEIAFFQSYYDEGYEQKRSEERETGRFSAALYAVNEQNPLIAISPDYNENDANSPLLCRIIPSMASFKLLHEAMHGMTHTVDPFYTVGNVSVRMIRHLDENYAHYGLKRQARPVELVHPDVKKNKTPHSFFSHNFELTTHDFLHCWRSGALTQKPLLRYLRGLLDQRGFVMSKVQWTLTDMDTFVGRCERLDIKAFGDQQKRIKAYFFELLSLYTRHRAFDVHHDEIVLLVLDMIRHRERWRLLLGMNPEDLFIYHTFRDPEIVCLFFSLHDRMKAILSGCKDASLNNPLMFYCIANRLWDDPAGVVALLQIDASAEGLAGYFRWTRNDGIHLVTSRDAVSKDTVAIESLSLEQLTASCCQIAKKVSQSPMAEHKETMHRKKIS